MSISIEKAEVNGFTMNYFQFGTGERTMVILPGLSIGSVMPSAQLIADAYRIFADEYTVYVFDRRNEVKEGYTLSQMAEDTVSVFKALGLNDIYLFGASQGGMMAMLIAIEYPELVSKLVLGSTAASINEQMKETVSRWIELARQGNASQLYLAFGEKIYPEEVYNASIELLKAAGAAVTAEDMERFILMAGTMNDYYIMERLKDIKCPTLILGARDDAVMGPQASKLLTAIPDSQLYMYEGYGHAAFDTAPDYKERMYRFFC
ncbi:MAG: alpha/beta hydrolase [Erysipelotrichaceae bacterium]|nr:alpha/beta hydrolase [Erysipelotrichaceae bacterium]